jgi:hypothetical protein
LRRFSGILTLIMYYTDKIPIPIEVAFDVYEKQLPRPDQDPTRIFVRRADPVSGPALNHLAEIFSLKT